MGNFIMGEMGGSFRVGTSRKRVPSRMWTKDRNLNCLSQRWSDMGLEPFAFVDHSFLKSSKQNV